MPIAPGCRLTIIRMSTRIVKYISVPRTNTSSSGTSMENARSQATPQTVLSVISSLLPGPSHLFSVTPTRLLANGPFE